MGGLYFYAELIIFALIGMLCQLTNIDFYYNLILMKVRHLLIAALGFCAMLCGCTENENVASGYPTIRISEKTINVETSDEYTQKITILATRPWSAAAVDTTQKWLIVEPLSGEASDEPQEVTLTVLPNAGFDRTASYRFNIGFDTKTVVVSQKGAAGSEEDAILYANDFDKEDTNPYYNSKKNWPAIDSLRYWTNEKGNGLSEMYYTYKGISVRANSESNGSYSDYKTTASGLNNLLFGTTNYLSVRNIKLNGNVNLLLRFGSEKYDSNDKNAKFSTEEFPIYLTIDGKKWLEVKDYTYAGTTAGRWNLATFEFAVPAGTDSIGIGFTTAKSGAYRMDDLLLMASPEEYSVLDFTKAVEKDFGKKDSGVPEVGQFLYKKVKKITSGKRYIMVTGKNCAVNAASTKNYGYLSAVEVKDSSSHVRLAEQTSEFIFTESSTPGQYTIKDSYGRLLYMSGTYNSFNFAADASEAHLWTAVAGTDSTFTITNVAKNLWIQWSADHSSFGAYSTQTGPSPFLYELVDKTQEDIPTEYKDETPEDAKKVTITFSTKSFDNGKDVSEIEMSETEGLSLTFNKAESSYVPKYYNTGAGVRVYGANTITISGTKNIRKAVFVFSSDTYAPAEGGFSTDKGRLWPDHEYTWLGNTKSLVVTNTSATGHWRVQSVDVYYTD